MVGILSKLKNSFVARVSLIYAIAAWLVVQIMEFVVTPFGLRERVAEVTAELAIINFLLALFFSWVIEAASPADRKYMFMRIAWAWGPMVVGSNMLIYGILGGSSITEAVAVWGLIGLVFLIWMQMSAPFARNWALRRAKDPDALIRAEQRLNWPMTPKEVKSAEIHIAPRLYYTFLAAIAALVFIITETLLSEFFGDTLGTIGYFEAAVIAVGIAAVLYPIHKRASKYVFLGSDDEAESGAKDAKSIALEIKTGLINSFKIAFLRYWYITIPGILLVWYFVAWVMKSV